MTVLRRLAIRRTQRAIAYVEGTLERARRDDLTSLRVIEVVASRRRGSEAVVVDEDGQTGRTWFWWYQAKVGEIVVCRDLSAIDGVLHVGSERERGVVDRVPRDIVDAYRRSDPTEVGSTGRR